MTPIDGASGASSFWQEKRVSSTGGGTAAGTARTIGFSTVGAACATFVLLAAIKKWLGLVDDRYQLFLARVDKIGTASRSSSITK